MSTPADGMDLTFRDIEAGLVALMRQREECAEEYDRVRADTVSGGLEELALAALDQCDAAIAAYLKAEVAKVDGVAAFILSRRARAQMNSDEADRLDAIATADERAADLIEKMALRVMQETEQRTIEGARHTLKLKRNPPAVVIAQPELVPNSFSKVTVTMPSTVWNAFITATGMPISYWRPQITSAKVEPSKSAIAAALKARETCGECNGTKRVPQKLWRMDGDTITPASETEAATLREVLGDEAWVRCPRCNGEGTIAGSVPGCRMESAERLVIE